MQAALRQCVVLGLTTNGPFLLDLLAHPAFIAGHTHTGFLGQHFPDWHPHATDDFPIAALAAALAQTHPNQSGQAGQTGTRTDSMAIPTPWNQLGGWRIGD